MLTDAENKIYEYIFKIKVSLQYCTFNLLQSSHIFPFDIATVYKYTKLYKCLKRSLFRHEQLCTVVLSVLSYKLE